MASTQAGTIRQQRLTTASSSLSSSSQPLQGSSSSRARVYRVLAPSQPPSVAGSPVSSGTATGLLGDLHEPHHNGGDTLQMQSKPPPSAPTTSWATREIAALDFLLGIPLAAERGIVRAGLSGGAPTPNDHGKVNMNANTMGEAASTTMTSASMTSASAPQHKAQQRSWWEKLIVKDKMFFWDENQQARRRARLALEERELERPEDVVLDETEHVAKGAEAMRRLSSTEGGGDFQKVEVFSMTSDIALAAAATAAPPGRRLDGRDAVRIHIPLGDTKHHHVGAHTSTTTSVGNTPSSGATGALTTTTATTDTKKGGAGFLTRHKTVARQAAIREWEIRIAHGLSIPQGGLLDGRAFLSSAGSYPVGVFSVIKYEPEKEEAARQRKRLEELGGGGTEFVVPHRDWRGTAYRALLPRVEKKNKSFYRTLHKRHRSQTLHLAFAIKSPGATSLEESVVTVSKKAPAATTKQRRRPPFNKRSSKQPYEDEEEGEKALISETEKSHGSRSNDNEEDDNESISTTSSSDESDAYTPGFLDDPEMVQGRHRHVMVGDKVTGPIVSSTIQFVKPADLKADLNKQFRERFDGWEPTKSQRKLIGAKVVDGIYTLVDPTELTQSEEDLGPNGDGNRHRDRKGSVSMEKATVRMPPSLTLSKIRSVKQQALIACVRAQLEVSTVAVACVYFERLCLDCRVDKTNRRLAFASCLLLSAKINEANIAIVHDRSSHEPKKGGFVLNSLIRPTKKSENMFASLLEFFTRDWCLSLKNLFSAEWGVFAALGFDLNATPSQVAFHFKRLMKVLEFNHMSYLGVEMYDQWQECLLEESVRREERESRRNRRRNKQERKLMKLQREFHKQQKDEMIRHATPTPAKQQRRNTWDGEEYQEEEEFAQDAASHESDPPIPTVPEQQQAEAPALPPKIEKYARRGSIKGAVKPTLWNRLRKHASASNSVENIDKMMSTQYANMPTEITTPPLTSPSRTLQRSISTPEISADINTRLNVVIDIPDSMPNSPKSPRRMSAILHTNDEDSDDSRIDRADLELAGGTREYF